MFNVFLVYFAYTAGIAITTAYPYIVFAFTVPFLIALYYATNKNPRVLSFIKQLFAIVFLSVCNLLHPWTINTQALHFVICWLRIAIVPVVCIMLDMHGATFAGPTLWRGSTAATALFTILVHGQVFGFMRSFVMLPFFCIHDTMFRDAERLLFDDDIDMLLNVFLTTYLLERVLY